MKKKLILIISLVLLACIAIGGTIAYLVIKTNEIDNKFTLAKISVEVIKTEDDDGNVSYTLKNNSDISAYVRFAIVSTWVNESDHSHIHSTSPVEGTDYTFDLAEDVDMGSVENKQCYYIAEPMAAGAEHVVIRNMKMSENATPPEGYELNIEIVTEGIQSDPVRAVQNSWHVNVDEIGKITPKEHRYDDGVVTKAATCTEIGEKVFTCLGCGDSYTEVLPIIAHNISGVLAEVVSPTCTETGLTESRYCTMCDAVITYQELVPATGHKEVTDDAVAATCTTTGLTEGRHCGVCNTVLVEQITIPATGHTAVVTESAVPATCTTDGKTEVMRCGVCDVLMQEQQTVDALGHSYNDGVVTNEATCTEKGVITYRCTREGCTDGYTEETDALGHDMKAVAVAKEATCEEEGDMTYTCTRCDAVDTEKTPALGHDYNDGVVTNEATCTEKGVMTFRCTRVGCTDSKTEDINALGHIRDVVEVQKAATCTEAGEDTYTCVRCTSRVTEETPALGHDYNDGVISTEATCMEKGVMTFRCKRDGCTESKTEDIDALGHTETVYIDEVPSTCIAEGRTQGTRCFVCETVLVESTAIAKAAHRYDEEGTVTRAPTCSVAGEKTCMCLQEGCAETEIRSIPVLPHTEVVDNAVVAQCETTGLTEGKHCNVCQTVLVAQQTVPALGHDESGAAATCTTAKMCKRGCGTVLQAALGHIKGAEATCTTNQTCTRGCGTIFVYALGHQAGAAATCETAQTCIRGCGYVYASALGHVPGAAATCVAAQVCTRSGCGKELEAKNAFNHGYSKVSKANGAVTCALCSKSITPKYFWNGQDLHDKYNAGAYGNYQPTVQADGSALISGAATAAGEKTLSLSLPNGGGKYIAIVYKANVNHDIWWCHYNTGANNGAAHTPISIEASSNWHIRAYQVVDHIHQRTDIRFNISSSNVQMQIAYIAAFDDFQDWLHYVNAPTTYVIPT